MRMLPVVAIAFGLGFTLILFNMVGAFALFDSSHSTQPIEGEVQDAAADAENESIDPEENTGFFSYVSGALGTLGSVVGIVAFLPSTLESIGFPRPVAWLVGRSSQVVIMLGLIQIAIQWEVR